MYVNIIIPAYKRFESLKRTLRSIKESDYKETCAIVVIDGFQDDRYAQFKNDQTTLIYNSERIGWPASMNKALKLTGGNLFLYGADDIKFYPDCISKLVESMNSLYPSGDGLVTLKQSQKRSGGAFGLMGNKFVERFPERAVFCPDYDHFGSDAELRDFATKAGLYYYRTDAVVWHDRSFRSEAVHDEAFTIGRALRAGDLGTYKTRKRKGYLWGENFYRLHKEDV